MKIQHEGSRAFLDGKSPKDNPYGRSTEEEIAKQEQWFRGYAASRTERARLNAETAQNGEK